MTEEANKLIVALREDAEWAHANEWETPITLGDHLDEAADLIESLSAQLDQVTRERDAAVEELDKVKSCENCVGYKEFLKIDGNIERCLECDEHDLWQWRGVEVE